MAINTSLRAPLYTSIAEAVYNEITSLTGRYYYFLGKTLEWRDELTPPKPKDSFEYELGTRENIILFKQVRPGDVSFVVDRIDWESGTIYDIYDDRYTDEVIGVNVVNVGQNYSANTSIAFTGGGATYQATANVTIVDGEVVGANLDYGGQGYLTAPTITITDAGNTGSGATLTAVINRAYSGANTLANATFYVVTDDYNIYKCLDNNYDAASTVKPADTSVEPFTLSDGYKWKFLGTVPPSLRNKFLSDDSMPILTSLTSSFYSRGELKSVNILNTGENYTSASITVDGDGFLEKDPYYIISCVVAEGGDGYTLANTTITIDPPVSFSTTWSASTAVYVGTRLIHDNKIYEVVIAGTTGAVGPVHTVGTGPSGSATLKYLGTRATGNISISANAISGVTLDGIVREITLTDTGSGYITAPNVTISGGGGSGAAAYSIIENNAVTKVFVTHTGSSYTSAPTVTIGTQWVANANAVTFLNTQLFYSDRLYTVSNIFGDYTLNATAPTHTTGVNTYGNVSLTFAGNAATATSVLRYGAGYTAAPNVVITGDGANGEIDAQVIKSEAYLIPIVESGMITGVQVEDGGIGYTNAILTVIGDGTNARISVNISEGDLLSVQATNELLTTAGTIDTIKVVSNGTGYSTATVNITGDGTGATANATVVNGRVTKVVVTNPGAGYTKANVIIAGSGSGATARPIIAPRGGHGKDIVSELNSRSLALFTSITSEKNQGFTVSNDYRQFGIVKDIRTFNDTKYYASITGSTCWVLTGTSVDTSLVTTDSILTTSAGVKYLVVESNETSALVLSIDNIDPQVGINLSVNGTAAFTVTGATKPDVDKYSGKLLYIDNRNAFTTTDQAVSIRTVFKY